MNIEALRRRTGMIMLAVSCLITQPARGQDEVTTLISRLFARPFDEAALYAFERQPADSRIIPALEAAFDRLPEKSDRQAIAVTLIRLGSNSGRLFGFLASYAQVAVEDRTPF